MSHLISPNTLKKAMRKLAERGMHLPSTSSRQEVAQAIAMVENRPIPKGGADIGLLIRQFVEAGAQPRQEKPPEYNPWPTMGSVYARIRMDFGYKGLK